MEEEDIPGNLVLVDFEKAFDILLSDDLLKMLLNFIVLAQYFKNRLKPLTAI
jgi:hypothetical protein